MLTITQFFQLFVHYHHFIEFNLSLSNSRRVWKVLPSAVLLLVGSPPFVPAIYPFLSMDFCATSYVTDSVATVKYLKYTPGRHESGRITKYFIFNELFMSDFKHLEDSVPSRSTRGRRTPGWETLRYLMITWYDILALISCFISRLLCHEMSKKFGSVQPWNGRVISCYLRNSICSKSSSQLWLLFSFHSPCRGNDVLWVLWRWMPLNDRQRWDWVIFSDSHIFLHVTEALRPPHVALSTCANPDMLCMYAFVHMHAQGCVNFSRNTLLAAFTWSCGYIWTHTTMWSDSQTAHLH